MVRVGDIIVTNKGGSCMVTDYENKHNITVQFLDKHQHVVRTSATSLTRGTVRNPFQPTLYGVGFCGVGKHLVSKSGKVLSAYNCWSDMLRRSYDKKLHIKLPRYKECFVSPDWHNFQVFAEWYYSQYKEDGWYLDKDILYKGNKEYSSRTCSFVPQEINSLITQKNASRGAFPLGVTRSDYGYYRVHINLGRGSVCLGRFDSVEDAFLAYKTSKELYVKSVAEKYKYRITEECYTALVNWVVLITD